MSSTHFDMGARSHRRLDYETNELELKHVQVLFVEWLCGDRPADETQADFARRHGVNPSTLSKWKKDPSFVANWERRMRETHAAPDKQHILLEKLYEKASASGDEKAVEAYFRLIDKMTPQRIEINSKDALAEMDDDEFEAAAAEAGLRVVGD